MKPKKAISFIWDNYKEALAMSAFVSAALLWFHEDIEPIWFWISLFISSAAWWLNIIYFFILCRK
jgi:hypothetical protein